MKLLVLCLVAAMAAAQPPRGNVQTNDAQLLRFDIEPYDNGFYKYSFEQSDGTKAEQQGQLKNEGRDDEFLAVKGSFSWVGPDGVNYTVNYVADDNGYQPEIEQGPGGAVPPDIICSLIGCG